MVTSPGRRTLSLNAEKQDFIHVKFLREKLKFTHKNLFCFCGLYSAKIFTNKILACPQLVKELLVQ